MKDTVFRLLDVIILSLLVGSGCTSGPTYTVAPMDSFILQAPLTFEERLARHPYEAGGMWDEASRTIWIPANRGVGRCYQVRDAIGRPWVMMQMEICARSDDPGYLVPTAHRVMPSEYPTSPMAESPVPAAPLLNTSVQRNALPPVPAPSSAPATIREDVVPAAVPPRTSRSTPKPEAAANIRYHIPGEAKDIPEDRKAVRQIPIPRE